MHACLRSHRGELSDACRREELILETTESERIELRPNLLRSCASERGLFCKDVKPGNARVFRCGVLPGAAAYSLVVNASTLDCCRRGPTGSTRRLECFICL